MLGKPVRQIFILVFPVSPSSLSPPAIGHDIAILHPALHEKGAASSKVLRCHLEQVPGYEAEGQRGSEFPSEGWSEPECGEAEVGGAAPQGLSSGSDLPSVWGDDEADSCDNGGVVLQEILEHLGRWPNPFPQPVLDTS